MVVLTASEKKKKNLSAPGTLKLPLHIGPFGHILDQLVTSTWSKKIFF